MRDTPKLAEVLKVFEARAREEGEESWLDDVISNKKLTRDTFFEAAWWAILVANMKKKTADTWVENARNSGFPFDWRKLGKWNDDDGQFDAWCQRMANTLRDPKDDLAGMFKERWWGIWDIGWRLAQFEDEKAFRKAYFGGKENGRELNDDDYHRLLTIKRNEGALYRIGEVSVYFILRNLGGDFLKPDTWIEKVAEWYGCTVGQLAQALRTGGLSCGRFDAYCWAYCESRLSRADDLPPHFDELFNPPK